MCTSWFTTDELLASAGTKQSKAHAQSPGAHMFNTHLHTSNLTWQPLCRSTVFLPYYSFTLEITADRFNLHQQQGCCVPSVHILTNRRTLEQRKRKYLPKLKTNHAQKLLQFSLFENLFRSGSLPLLQSCFIYGNQRIFCLSN